MDVPKGNLEELPKAFCTSDDKKTLKLTKLLVPVNLLNEIKTKQNIQSLSKSMQRGIFPPLSFKM